MKTLVLGGGFVGKPLAAYLEADLSTSLIEELEHKDLRDYQCVINTVAKTSIDWCETHREEAFEINVLQALRIARLTEGKYVYFSSGCIFKSDTPEQINYEL